MNKQPSETTATFAHLVRGFCQARSLTDARQATSYPQSTQRQRLAAKTAISNLSRQLAESNSAKPIASQQGFSFGPDLVRDRAVALAQKLFAQSRLDSSMGRKACSIEMREPSDATLEASGLLESMLRERGSLSQTRGPDYSFDPVDGRPIRIARMSAQIDSQLSANLAEIGLALSRPSSAARH
jgi:hypothetical protein